MHQRPVKWRGDGGGGGGGRGRVGKKERREGGRGGRGGREGREGERGERERGKEGGEQQDTTTLAVVYSFSMTKLLSTQVRDANSFQRTDVLL